MSEYLRDQLQAVWESRDWQQQREHILKAHGYKCVHCGEQNKRLQVHHTDIGDYQDIERYEQSLALEIVCIDCHADLHGYVAPDKTVDAVVLSVLRRYPTHWFTYEEVVEKVLLDFPFNPIDVRTFYLDRLPIYAACKRHREKATHVDSVRINGIWYISYWRKQ